MALQLILPNVTEKTLRAARQELRERREDGVSCPCCDQLAKVYRRKLNSTMVRGLIWLAQAEIAHPDRWVHVGKFGPRFVLATGGQFHTVAHWGLVETKSNDDTKKKGSGLWRTTSAGQFFVGRQTKVPARVHLYDGKVVGWSEEQASIVDCLGRHFDYEELMKG